MLTDGPGLTTVIPVREDSQIADARRQIAALAQAVGFDEEGHGRIAIVATELATNLVRHGNGGLMLLRLLSEQRGIELIACDSGPGMADISECMRDGFSTGGTSGNGLGAIRRLAGVFDLFSAPDLGTVVLAQVFAAGQASQSPVRFGVVCIPLAGETECGDQWQVQLTLGRTRIAVADGLGHGPDAAQASLSAIMVVEQAVQAAPALVIERVHQAIAASRGAAMAVCDIEPGHPNAVRFCGIGNITGVVIGRENQRSMISLNGIVGHHQRKTQEFTYPWSSDALLIMHSDGLQTRWSLDPYPGLRNRHPSIIATVLMRDFSRGRDDLCIVVVKDER